MNEQVGDAATGLVLIALGVAVGAITIAGRWPIVILALLYPWDVQPGAGVSLPAFHAVTGVTPSAPPPPPASPSPAAAPTAAAMVVGIVLSIWQGLKSLVPSAGGATP